jgi:hypothetical protein
MATYVLNRNKLSVVVDGQLMQGAGDSDYVKVIFERENSMVIGVDGQGGYVIPAGSPARVEITLQEGSPSNKTMFEIWQKQQAGTGFLPAVSVQDESGGIRAETAAGLIQKLPDIVKGKDASENVWVVMAVATQAQL